MSDDELLHKAINCAKVFQDFQGVLLAVSLHPEWLTLIPQGRKWAILHQIVLSGDVDHLEQLLALQKSNKEFRLLTSTCDQKTALDIARSVKDAPRMLKRIQQLVELDQMLDYARDYKWDACYNMVKENPSLVNAKPPYRCFYLIHYMACANAIAQYEGFKQIKDCKFDLNLRADRKTVNVIAREAKQLQFAQFIERQCPSLSDRDDLDDDQFYRASDEARKQTKAINIMMEQKTIIRDLDQNLMGEPTNKKSREEILEQIPTPVTERERQQEASSINEDDRRKNILLSNLTCPLTFAVFLDPVLAADGFTYERSAIVKWFEKNDRSPMTNQELQNKTLSPNNIVKRIIDALQSTS